MAFTPFLLNPTQLQGGLEQEAFRWRNDNGTESSATWIAAQDSAISLSLDTRIRLRILVNTQNISAGGKKFRLEYKRTVDNDWTPVDAGSPSEGRVQIAGSPNIAPGGGATTLQLTPPPGSPKNFLAGRIVDDSNESGSITFASDDYTEIEWAIIASSAAGASSSDIYQFRVTADDGNAFAFVQSATGSNDATGSSIATSSTLNITAGAHVVCWVSVRDDPSYVLNVTDGTNYATRDYRIQELNGYRLEVWSFKNHPGGSSLTFTANFDTSTGPFRQIAAAEFSTAGGLPEMFSRAFGTGDSASPSSGNISPTPTVDGNLIVGMANGNNQPSASGSFTGLNQTSNRSASYYIQPTAAAIAATWTMSSSLWAALGGGFRFAVSEGSTTPTRTGTASQVDASGANGSTSVTVPGDCDYIVATWGQWDNATGGITDLTLNGVSFSILEQQQDTSNRIGVGVAVLANPATSTQTLAWTWQDGGARTEGGGILLTYVKNHRSGNAVRGFGTVHLSGSSTATVRVDSKSSDLVLAFGVSFNANATLSGSLYVDNWVLNLQHYDASQLTAGSGITEITCGGTDASIAAISLKPS